MDSFPKLKHWLDDIVGSSKHVSQLGLLSLERDGTRERVSPEELWVLSCTWQKMSSRQAH